MIGCKFELNSETAIGKCKMRTYLVLVLASMSFGSVDIAIESGKREHKIFRNLTIPLLSSDTLDVKFDNTRFSSVSCWFDL